VTAISFITTRFHKEQMLLRRRECGYAKNACSPKLVLQSAYPRVTLDCPLGESLPTFNFPSTSPQLTLGLPSSEP
jgi:hypothetical protein